MKKFKWKPTTHKQLRKQMGVFKRMLHLRDWKFYLNTKNVPSREMKLHLAEKDGEDDDDSPDYMFSGRGYVMDGRQEAYIWVPLGTCEADNEDPTEVLFHEISHIFYTAYHENEELMVSILSEAVFPLIKEI